MSEIIFQVSACSFPKEIFWISSVASACIEEQATTCIFFYKFLNIFVFHMTLDRQKVAQAFALAVFTSVDEILLNQYLET